MEEIADREVVTGFAFVGIRRRPYTDQQEVNRILKVNSIAECVFRTDIRVKHSAKTSKTKISTTEFGIYFVPSLKPPYPTESHFVTWTIRFPSKQILGVYILGPIN